MAGHSKWANIKHRKGAQDAKRGKVFTKHIRAITVAAKIGGGDLESNPRLRGAVDKALAVNMTRDTINRAIKRGAGGGDEADLFEIRYEGYGTAGTAIIVDCLTDNRNRTVAEVRHAFTKAGGNLGTDGSVAFQFQKKGILNFPKGPDEEKIMELAIESGADDVITEDDGSITVYTSTEDFHNVVKAFEDKQIMPQSSEITMIPDNEVKLDLEKSEKMMRLVDMLEDLDDVQNVYSNADLDDALFEDN